MSTLSKLFSGYTGSGQIVKNDKFLTTKNNHNRDGYNRPTVIYGYSRKYLVLWFGKKSFNFIMEDARDTVNKGAEYNEATYIYGACLLENHKTNLPSYLNPIYHRAYHQPKHRR